VRRSGSDRLVFFFHFDFGRDCRAASRYWFPPSNRFNNLGCRVAAVPHE
jgi:hypothetical protein